MDLQAKGEIENAVDEFARGNPQSFELLVAEGVWFDFDCPFDGDLSEPVIPIAVGIHSWSPHNQGEPEHSRLMDYGNFGDELSCQLEEAFHNAGSRNEELVMEYSEHNSSNDNYIFLGSIHNPRVAMTKDGVEVTEDYA